jgi:peptide-methionine (S)-S-oxide reductase
MKRTLTAVLLAVAATIAPVSAQEPAPGLAVATFGSGCFWCTESDFDKVDGVVKTTSGYMGGLTRSPTYEQVSTGRTGHAEVVQITYDPAKVSYEKLLDVYWKNTDPLDASGQFCDKGSQYRPVIFTHTDEQKKLADASKQALIDSKRFKQPIVVEIKTATDFTPAEDYHQDFYKKSPGHYKRYRTGCGRDARLEALWGKPTTN